MNYIRKFWKSYNLNTPCFFLFYMAVCFPFVGHFYMTDTQPWALFLAIIFISIYVLIERNREYSFYTNALIAIFVASIVIGCLSMKQVGGYSSIMRSGANYASVFFITMASYIMFKKQGGLKEPWIKLVIWIWLIVGMIQKFVDAGFARQILSTSRTDVLRGVCCLAAEPSFYGYMCLFFILFALEFRRLKWLYIGILVYQIIILANSSLTIVYLAVLMFMFFVQSLAKGRKLAILMIPLGAIAFGIARIFVKDQYQSSRIMDLLRKVLYRPDELITDKSVMIRLESITTSFDKFFSNFGMPSGMSSVRITSGYGALLVELGCVGVVAIVLYFMIMLDGRYKFVTAAGMTIIMFSGIQLACPMFSFYLGYCLYKKQERIEQQHLNREDI